LTTEVDYETGCQQRGSADQTDAEAQSREVFSRQSLTVTASLEL